MGWNSQFSLLFVNQNFSGVYLFIYFVLDLIYLDLFSEISYCFVVVFIVGICYTTSLVMVLEQWLWCVLGCL
jgi:hypothetical protein